MSVSLVQFVLIVTMLFGSVVPSGEHLSGDWSLVTIGRGRTPQGRGEEWVRWGHLITIDHMTTILLCHWFNSLLKH